MLVPPSRTLRRVTAGALRLTAALASAASLDFHVSGVLAAVLGSLIVARAGWVIRSG